MIEALLCCDGSSYVLGASVDPVRPQSPLVCVDPARGNSSRSYTLGTASEEDKVVSSLEVGETGDSH